MSTLTPLTSLPTPVALSARWKHSAGAPLQQLVLAGDRLLAVTDSELISLDIYAGLPAGTTETIASQAFPYGFVGEAGDAPEVVAAAGVVYFIDGPNGDTLMARRLSDGAVLRGWPNPVLGQVSAMFAVENRVIAVILDGGTTEVVGYSATDGALLFGPVRVSNRSPGPLSYGDGAVFFVADGVGRAVNVDYGDDRWTYPRQGGALLDTLALNVPPLVTDDIVVFVGKQLYGLNLRTGDVVWTVAPETATDAGWFAPVLGTDGTSAVACNRSGEVVALSLADGTVRWRCRLVDPGAPTVAGGMVHIPCTSNGGHVLALIHCDSGAVAACYQLDAAAVTEQAVIGNGTVFIPTSDGSIIARCYAEQTAAGFDGISSQIDIKPCQNEFDFGLGDFTVEAWIKSCVGGEIVSSYPTQGGERDHGFRLNMDADGRLRVAVASVNLPNPNVAQTEPTWASDGEWHHVGLLRRSGAFKVLLDGLSLDLELPDDPSESRSIGGKTALTIGAYAPKPDYHEEHFQGLIREVRVWGDGPDVAAIQSNLRKELAGTEASLRGLWSLDDDSGDSPTNAAAKYPSSAKFTNAVWEPTDLSLDRSAFPYLLPNGSRQWPYAGGFAARGEMVVSSVAGISPSGTVVAFSTSNAVYGVARADGHRLWNFDFAEGASAPVADGAGFLVMTGDKSLLCLDAQTGRQTPVAGFDGLADGAAAFLPAPATTAQYIAAASAQGKLWILDRQAQTVQKVALTVTPRLLAFGASRLIVAAGDKGAFTLMVIDPASGNVQRKVTALSQEFAVDGDWLMYVGRSGVSRLDLSAGDAARTSTSVPPSSVSGLAAARDHDLLVVSAADGQVLGLSLANLTVRWTAQIAAPLGQTSAGSVYRAAFDEAGRIYCTTANGAVAVLDPGNGSVLGFYQEQQGIVAPPVVYVGTVYFGCLDGGMQRDGALHSVVFGETMALRLGVDAQGRTIAQSATYGHVEADASQCTLHLMDPTRSCVEAWVNIPVPSGQVADPGGGILAVCPSGSDDAFDLGLSVTAGGVITYTSHSKGSAGWSGVSAQGVAALCDGRWHHLAVSRRSATQVVMYVDGQQLLGVVSKNDPTAPARTSAGLQAYLGASADANLAATNMFRGMIAEIRVWDSYLEACEISSRMNVKLRGDEPDLAACWDFDRDGIHDTARQGHDGQIENAGAAPNRWLVDLPFTHPEYPEILTSAGMVAQPSSDKSGTTYELTVSVQRADGTGLPSEDMELWYVRHDPSEPDTITVDGAVLQAIAPGEIPDPTAEPAKVHLFETDADGAATLTVTTPLALHGPSLDLRADFMPANERFHTNCLIDNQSIRKLTPPKLIAQTKLIQDYHYSPGSKIDETRDRSTHSVTITALDGDKTLLPNEPISLWASATLAIEVAGQTYTIGPDNSAGFETNSVGELVVVLAANDISTATLYAHAGFMHANDRVLISPDDDAHTGLANLQGTTLSQPQPINWKPGGSETATALSAYSADQADQAAQAVRHVMAAVKPGASPPAAALRAAGALTTRRALAASAKQIDFSDMRQSPEPACANLVPALRTIAGSRRRPPVSPDGLRTSLGTYAGFAFACGGSPGSFSYTPLQANDAKAALGLPTPKPALLGGIFRHIWKDLKKDAKDVYKDATKIVVVVDDAITIAVHAIKDGLNTITHIVVDSIEKAVQAVAAFFVKLGLAIERLIRFLRALFDWTAIMRAQKILKDWLGQIAKQLASDDFGKRATTSITEAFASAGLLSGTNTTSLPAGSPMDSAPAQSDPTVTHAHGGHAKWLLQKLFDHGRHTTGSCLVEAADGASRVPSPSGWLGDLLGGVAGLAPDLLTGDPKSSAKAVAALLAPLQDGKLDRCRDWTSATVSCVASGMGDLLAILDQPIKIPFLSPLFEWIFGIPISIVNVTTFVAGAMVHVAYLAVMHSCFADDAGGWFRGSASSSPRALAAVRAPLTGSSAGDTPPPDDTPRLEVTYTILRTLHAPVVYSTDMLFNRYGKDKILRSLLMMIRGLLGVSASTLAFFGSLAYYQHRLEQADLTESNTQIETRRWLGYCLSLVADGATMFLAAGGVISASSGRSLPLRNPVADRVEDGVAGPVGPAENVMGKTASTWRDKAEATLLVCNAVGALALIALQGYLMAKDDEYKPEKNKDTGLRAAAYLIAARFIAFSVPKLFGYLYTQTGLGDTLINPVKQRGIARTRLAAQLGGTAFHTAAFAALGVYKTR